MIKPGAKWIMRELTDVWSHRPNGTLHSYDYFENENGQWIYNIDFHYDGCFAPAQLKLPKRISITRAVQKARKIFENTTYCDQPDWND